MNFSCDTVPLSCLAYCFLFKQKEMEKKHSFCTSDPCSLIIYLNKYSDSYILYAVYIIIYSSLEILNFFLRMTTFFFYRIKKQHFRLYTYCIMYIESVKKVGGIFCIYIHYTMYIKSVYCTVYSNIPSVFFVSVKLILRL